MLPVGRRAGRKVEVDLVACRDLGALSGLDSPLDLAIGEVERGRDVIVVLAGVVPDVAASYRSVRVGVDRARRVEIGDWSSTQGGEGIRMECFLGRTVLAPLGGVRLAVDEDAGAAYRGLDPIPATRGALGSVQATCLDPVRHDETGVS